MEIINLLPSHNKEIQAKKLKIEEQIKKQAGKTAGDKFKPKQQKEKQQKPPKPEKPKKEKPEKRTKTKRAENLAKAREARKIKRQKEQEQKRTAREIERQNRQKEEAARIKERAGKTEIAREIPTIKKDAEKTEITPEDLRKISGPRRWGIFDNGNILEGIMLEKMVKTGLNNGRRPFEIVEQIKEINPSLSRADEFEMVKPRKWDIHIPKTKMTAKPPS